MIKKITFTAIIKSSFLHVSLLLLLTALFEISCADQAVVVPESGDRSTTTIDSVTLRKKALAAIQQSKALLQDGDLVTRSDDDFESRTLQNFSKRDQSYSHSGIVYLEDSVLTVYHSMTGVENPQGTCRKDPFDSFVNPALKTGFGIFRYDLTNQERTRFHKVLQRNFAAAIPFDISFDLATNDAQYCSEMIYKALKEATGNRVVLPVSVLNNYKPKILGYRPKKTFYKKFEYIGIDDLYLNPFCKEILRVKY